MKISIKKIYVVSFFTIIIFAYLYNIVSLFLREISQKNIATIIFPLIIILLICYVINYFYCFYWQTKIAEETAKEVAKNNSVTKEEIKEHLVKKLENEAYTFNFLFGKIIFTSSWEKQQKIDRLKSNKNVPEIIRRELIK